MKLFWQTLFIPFTLTCILFSPYNNAYCQNALAQVDSLGFWRLEKVQLLRKDKQITTANELAVNTIAFFKKQEDWENWGKAYEELYLNARYVDSQKALQLGIDQFKSALQVLNNRSDIPIQAQSTILARTGYLYHNLGEYADALKYYKKAFSLAEVAQDDDYLMRLYASAASVTWALGDDYQAISYFEKALPFAQAQQNNRALVYIYSNMANAWRTLNSPKSIDLYLQALELDPINSNVKTLLSKGYLDVNKDYKKALKTAEGALKLAEVGYEKTDALHQLGRVHFTLKNYDTSISYYQKALVPKENDYHKSNPEYAKIYRFIGEAHLAKKQFKEALIAYNHTLDLLLPLFSPNSEEQNPTEEELTELDLWVLESLQGKSRTFSKLSEISNEQKYQEKALSTAELAVQILQRIKTQFGEDESKYALNSTYFSSCDFAMSTAFKLAQTTNSSDFFQRAFHIANQNKAVVLSEALHRKEIKHLAGVPDNLLGMEKKIHQNIANYRKKLADTKEPNDLQLIKDSLFLAKESLNKFELNLEEVFPAYAKAKFSHRNQQTLSEIQNELTPKTILIEYFLTDSTLYTFKISKNDFQAHEQSRTILFDKKLAAFLRSISDWQYVEDSTAFAAKDYLESSYFLYQFLLEKSLKNSTEERLVIVPDGILGLVPFEVLMTAPYAGDWTDRAVPFLIKERALSYRFSTGYSLKKSGERIGSWGGFGSEHRSLSSRDLEALSENMTGLVSLRNGGILPFADDEIREISEFFNSITWLNEEATRENFLKNAEDFGILHLATHGIVNRQDPLQSRLLFSSSEIDGDPSVYAHEIYGMQLKAGLTVLSACNTGTGTWKRGEGVMSLARAFSFAGCPSVVMSLWNVSDQSTSEIMIDFYKNLKTGNEKDIALQRAKLNYLETSSTEYAKPIYWASFVGIGNMDALAISSEGNFFIHNKWWISGIILLIIAILLYIWVRKQIKS